MRLSTKLLLSSLVLVIAAGVYYANYQAQRADAEVAAMHLRMLDLESIPRVSVCTEVIVCDRWADAFDKVFELELKKPAYNRRRVD